MTPPPPPPQFSPVPSTLPDLVNDHDHHDENDNTMSDFNDLFDFDGYASDSHSLTTVSPNRTPSPFRTSFSPFIARSTSPFKTNNAYGSGSGSASALGSRSTTDEVKVKEEPMDWQDYGFDFGSTNELGSAPIDMPSFSPVAPPAPAPTLAPPIQQAPTPTDWNFAGLPKDQQDALQQLMMNIYQYQNNFGTELPGTGSVPTPQPTTIEPSLVFSTSPTNTFTTAPASASNTASYTATPQLSTIPETEDVTSKPDPIEVDDDEEPLRSVEPHEMTAPGPSRIRQSSIFSSTSDISSKLDRLAPREAIFSAGKGKGGKKGGGLSSVVRGDDEDLDDDDSWRPSPEEYKKLSSKEKRQLRNKLSARAFRTRRKDYIGTLEGHIKDRDDVIDEMRAELMQHRNENRDLRKELETLKAHTMKILHPETAPTTSAPVQGLLNTLAASPALAPKSVPAKRAAPSSPAITPKFNPRKDLPSSSTEASRGFWGQDNLFGGGSTICHHTFVPPPSFKQNNINPLLNSEPITATPSTASSKDLSMPFHEWSADNQFNLRSMDSYRMQIWSRLTREAQAEKDKVPMELRPKFYVETKPAPSPSTSTSTSTAEASLAAHLANAATNHITTKLATSFWSAFSGVNTSFDTDKLTAVVTGQAKLSVVPTSTSSTYNEKSGVLDEEGLSALMGGLKLQTGGIKLCGVRENPLGVFSSFIKSAGCH